MTENIDQHIFSPIGGLALMGEPPDSIQMISQGDNGRFFHRFASMSIDLTQAYAGQQAVAQTTAFPGVELQAAFINKTIHRRGRAALEKVADSRRIGLAETALL